VLTAEGKDHGVQYVQHTSSGSYSTVRNRQTSSLRWIAPPEAAGPVAFHLVANAANDDDSQFGDFIYTGEWVRRVVR
jgi:hypothetical protein